MKKITILILCCIPLILKGQVTIDKSHYPNGQLEWKGKKKCVQKDNGNKYYKSFGLWKYWYKSGQLKLETIDNRYVNMWESDGTQILKNGQGYYYSLEYTARNTDSLIYEVKDSIINGKFQRFRKWNNDEKYGEYYLIAEGSSYKKQLEGDFWFHDSKLNRMEFLTYENDEKHGDYKLYNNKRNKLEIGKYCNGVKCSEWKYFENDKLKMIENYEGGIKIGKYYEYHENGEVRIEGQFIKIRKKVERQYYDLNKSQMVITKEEEDVGVKDKTWKEYDHNGKLIKEENYIKGEKLKN